MFLFQKLIQPPVVVPECNNSVEEKGVEGVVMVTQEVVDTVGIDERPSRPEQWMGCFIGQFKRTFLFLKINIEKP